MTMSDRKYRQRGYQDEPRDARAHRRPSRRAARAGPPCRPRRAEDAEPDGVARSLPVLALRQSAGASGRADGRCTRCGVDLHSCIQCVSFDTSARFECTQPLTARVAPKDVRNDVHALRRADHHRAPDRHRRVRRARGRPSTTCSSKVYRPSA